VSDVIDLDKRRKRNLPNAPFVDLGDLDEGAEQWLCQIFAEGAPVPNRCGIRFTMEHEDGSPVPAVAVSAAQARNLGEALIMVAEHLESAKAPQ
jgi:hypothetical protein